jgi:hypothetical protein
VTTEILTLSGTRGGEPFTLDVPVERPTGMLVGASTADNTKFNTLNAAVGPLQCRRTYDTNIPTTFSASRAGPDAGTGRRSYWSWKPAPATFPTSSPEQTKLRTFLQSKPAGHQLVVIAYHEPEDNIAANQFTLAQWKATQTVVGDICDEFGPDVRFCIDLMGPWTFDPDSPYDLWDFWDATFADTTVDVIGFDPYRWNPGDPSLQALMTINNSGAGGGGTTNPMKWARDHGKPVVLTEWGCTETNVTQASKAAWITAAYQWAKTQPDIEALVYFNNNLDVGGDPRATWELHDEPMAAFATACADARA